MDTKSKRQVPQASSPSTRVASAMDDTTRVGRGKTTTRSTEEKPRPTDDQKSTTTTPDLHQYAALGQLSYAPTTQTTVVTTTTTTTTSFPPLLMKAPRPLADRDPKQFPLAASPTPQSLRRLKFQIAGRQACFEEREDVFGAMTEYAQRQSDLEASNGTLQSVVKSDSPHSLQIAQHEDCSSKAVDHTPVSPAMKRKRRSISPPSIAEAAEIASLHRRTKKLRSSLHGAGLAHKDTHTSQMSDTGDFSGPATPETEHGFPQGLRTSSRANRLRKPSLRSHSKIAAPANAESVPRLPNTSTRSTLGRFMGASRSSSTSTLVGVSATPPIVEGDLDRVGPFEDPQHDAEQRRLPALDTVSAQDASLPSPSLSPITAAANVNSRNAATQDHEEEDNEVSSLDISQDMLSSQTSSNSVNRRHPSDLQVFEMPQAMAVGDFNPQLSASTLMDMPTMLDSFDAMPPEVQRYVMYQLLRRCSKDNLRFVADVVNPALKCDFLALLPLELSLQITKYFDAKSMCRAAQVSKKWRQILDSDESAWKNLLDEDELRLPEGELERAIREGWGWQLPHGPDSGEIDLSQPSSVEWSLAKSQAGDSPRSTASANADPDVAVPNSGRPKRKATSKHGSNKRQRRKPPSAGRQQTYTPISALDDKQGPIAHANAAAAAVSDAEIGLPSLRNLHLYKSLYRRHYLIRKSWMQDGMQPRHIAFRAHQRHVVTCLQFDADKILTGSDDTKINVYDTKTGAKRKTLEGHEGGVWALEYDGNTLVSGSTDRSVRVWDIETGKCLQVFQGHTSTVRCLVILKPAQVDVQDDGTPIMAPKQPLIITGSRDSSLRVWKLPKPGDRSVFQAGPPSNDYENPYFVRALTGHHHSVRAIAAHGDTLVSGSYDCTVRVWKISTGEMQHRLSGHAQKVYSVVLDHARKRCISGSMDNLVKVWSLEQGVCLFNLEGHTSLVGLLDLSHERLVSAAADSTLRIWDPDNGQCKATLTAHTGAITCFQHDDQKVISGSDRTLKLWDVKTGECTKDLLVDLSGVWQVKFNDRRCVAAVQRKNLTYIEVLDFGASRDGVPADMRGVRVVVDKYGNEISRDELDDQDDSLNMIE